MKYRFKISDTGTIEIANEHTFNEVIRAIWGPLKVVECMPGEDSYLKFDYEVGTWIDGAGFGVIEVPHFVAADHDFLELEF